LYQFAWKNPEESAPPGSRAPETPSAEPASAGGSLSSSEHESASVTALEAGEHTMHHAVGFAWLIGIGIGIFMYWDGYWIVAPLMRFTPLNLVRIWLYRRMYFDELYFSVFVGITMGVSALSAAFDRYIIDGLVNDVAHFVRRASAAAGLTDKYVVDGAVNGMADLAQDLGAAVRAPQTGRIRMYVTVLMAAVTLGLAGAIIFALSK